MSESQATYWIDADRQAAEHEQALREALKREIARFVRMTGMGSTAIIEALEGAAEWVEGGMSE